MEPGSAAARKPLADLFAKSHLWPSDVVTMAKATCEVLVRYPPVQGRWTQTLLDPPLPRATSIGRTAVANTSARTLWAGGATDISGGSLDALLRST